MRDILICGDVLRANLELTHRPYNTRWFSRLVLSSTESLGLKTEVLGHSPPNFDFDDFYKSVYKEAGPQVLDEWARYYDAQSFSEDMSARLFDIFAGKTVILFEGSRSILRYISSIGGTYINFRVGPLRFASDLMFIIQTNDPGLQHVIQLYALDQAYINEQTISLRTQMASSTQVFKRPSLIFLGQVPGDASLISNGRFGTIAIPDGLDISRFGADDIYHKPHPLADNPDEITRWKGFSPSSKYLDMPTYAAMCSQGPLTFVTVSSGSGYEAQVLGHECYFVSPHNWSLRGQRWKSFTPVLYEYWFPQFWQTIFETLEGKPPDEMAIAVDRRAMTFTPDRLRQAIAAKWASPQTL